jgi:hypothetical protein
MKNQNVRSSVTKEEPRNPRGAGLGRAAAAAVALAAGLIPQASHACACGCGVFDVATSSMLPQGPGGQAYLEYDFQDQEENWSGYSKAPAMNNGDQEIRTYWVTLGLQYMYSRSWGLQVEVPYENRTFKTTVAGTGPAGSPPGVGQQTDLNWGDLGDIRVKGIYTGIFSDMSLGLTAGLKLPTGNYTYNDSNGDVDRDSEIGTGSTDLLLGGFYRHNLTSDGKLTGFVQGELDLPFLTRDEYKPGIELDTAAGLYYHAFSLGRVHFTPVAQIIGSERTSDHGAAASTDPLVGGPDSGYQRILLSPGLEIHIHPVMIYGDVELPIYEHFTGNQLVAPYLLKFMVSYMF